MERLRENPLTTDKLEDYISKINCIRGQSIFLNPAELPEKIVAIGDIHGDLEALFSILLKSGIIDEHGRWIAVNTFLVQTGDIFDKGRLKPPLKSVGQPQNSPGYGRIDVPYDVIDKYGNAQTITGNHNFDFGEVGDELVILKFLTDLHVQASESEGKFGNSRVLLCTGNHEFMNTSQYDYFSDTPDEEVQRILVEGTQEEIQSEIDKRELLNQHKQPLRLSAAMPVEQQRLLLSSYVGINSVTIQQYAHPMDAILFGGPAFPIRREIFRQGRGYLARKLACILNVVVVVGDFIFSHGGINSVNLNTINDISELQLINNILRDYLLGNPTNRNDIKKYFIDDSTSILWNRHLGKENAPDRFVCEDTLELIRDKLDRPNLNIVIGHDIQATCIDPKADADITMPRIRNAWDRHNPDGTIDKCTILPTVWCNNQIYRIDTGISRMTNTPDYRTPNEGRLNSLIIELNPDGSKGSVNAMNGILGLQAPVRKD
jgi:hypothetical protein